MKPLYVAFRSEIALIKDFKLKPTSEVLAPAVLKELLEAIQSLRFGSIEITVHEGNVTQIEKREKLRFNNAKSTVSNSGKVKDD